MTKKVLVTGTAGFIGHHLALLLAENGYEVVGIDIVNDYYDPAIKWDRLALQGIDIEEAKSGKLTGTGNIKFQRLDLTDREGIEKLFSEQGFSAVVNLAAQAGVRYSLTNPYAYVDSNITGFLNILEGCRHYPVEHLIFASSSSVYGLSKDIPFKVTGRTDHPVAMYAASKKANEMMAHSYSHLYGIPATGLRFFTVYGPWGRPDMALFLFTKAMLADEPFDVYNFGNMSRDFTYVSDIVESIRRLIPLPPKPNNPDFDPNHPKTNISSAPYELFNIGNNSPVRLMDFIEAIEKELNIKGKKNLMEIQPGDVESTYADVQSLYDHIGFKPQTSIQEGIKGFVDWYLEYFKISKSKVQS